MPQPTCRTCGYVLRWFPDQHGWGCDQCRVMLSQATPSNTQTSLVSPTPTSNLPVIAGALASIAAGVGIAIALVGTGGRRDPTPATATTTAGSGSGAVGSGSGPPAAVTPGAAGAGSARSGEKPIGAAVAEGPPERSSVADIWLYTRRDGSVRVASPLFEVTFPHRPVITVKRNDALTADGKPFDIIRFADDTADGGMRHLEVFALGRDARIIGASDAVKVSFAKLGTVKETTRVELGIPIIDLEVFDKEDGHLRTRMTRDLARGVFISLTTLALVGSKDDAVDDVLRASLHLRAAPEPADDPTVLARVTVTKKGKKFVARDPAGTFEFELPWAGKVTRVTKLGGVIATVTATKKAARIQIDIAQMGSGDGLRRVPQWIADDNARAMASMAKLLGVPYTSAPWKAAGLDGGVKLSPRGKLPRKTKRIETWSVFDRGWNRLYMVTCVDTPCEAVAQSFQVTPPVPVP